MNNISFSHTTQQVRDFQKTVTRRNGWGKIKPGDILQGVVKGMGLKLGGKVEKIHQIQIVDNRPEPLDILLKLPEYGKHEMIKEGFPGRDPKDFVRWYCENNKKQPGDLINRIDFRYYILTDKITTLAVPESIALCPSCKQTLTISPDSWFMDNDGTMICDGYSQWCASEPDIEDDEAYGEFEMSHHRENSMPYVYWMPVQNAIDTWLADFFRFEVGGMEQA